MKRQVFILVMIFSVSLFFLADEYELLKIDASINPERLSRGQEGNVVLKFTLAKGITISPQPSFTIEMNQSEELGFPKNFFTASDLGIEILQENGEEYINFPDQIEIPFTVNVEANRGNHILEGKIKYFAFSKEEGWCLKNTSKFSIAFYTSSRTVKKK